jgi:anti-sigma B factor antagonist
MKIKTRTINDIKILDCDGRITLDEGTLVLRDAINDILQEGIKKVILNLGQVSYIDSSGIGELVKTHTNIMETGGQLRLINLKDKIWNPLIITNLMTVFKTYDDEAAAVASFD